MHTYYMHAMIQSPHDILGTLVHDVAHLLRLEIDRRVRGHGLTRGKWRALHILGEGRQLTQSELAGRLGLGAAATGRLVDRLVRRGFVERRPDPGDRRAYRLGLTDRAAAVLDELEGMSSGLGGELLDGLSADELASLGGGLRKLKKTLQDRSAAAVAAPLAIELGEMLEWAHLAAPVF